MKSSQVLIKALLYLVAPSIILLVFVAAFYLFFPHNPALDRTFKYRKEYAFVSEFPFVMPYFLMYPKEYDREKKYPLVFALHGGFGKNYGASQLAELDKRETYRSFVLLPYGPPMSLWANPERAIIPFYRYHILDGAMEILKEKLETLPIDKDRVYVTGSSNGGRGTFGALKKHPEIFAAGVAVNSDWAPYEHQYFKNKPLWIFLGANDHIFSASRNRELVKNMGENSSIKYTEYPGVGHKAWKYAYTDDEMWDWLFSQTLEKQ